MALYNVGQRVRAIGVDYHPYIITQVVSMQPGDFGQDYITDRGYLAESQILGLFDATSTTMPDPMIGAVGHWEYFNDGSKQWHYPNGTTDPIIGAPLPIAIDSYIPPPVVQDKLYVVYGPPQPTGGATTNLQQLESQIPGIGGALVKLTKGWDGLNWVEKGLILAAVALVGIEALAAVGVEVGVGTALLAVLKGIPLLGGLFKGSSGVSGVVPPGFTASWKANGVQFYRNGPRLGVMNTRGRFKTWTPKKPIVLYSDGTRNLKTLVKATKIIKKELAALQTSITQSESPRRSSGPKAKKFTLAEVGELRRALP
jgi:hypothetical protein